MNEEDYEERFRRRRRESNHWGCEEKVGHRRCRQKANAMTGMGKLLCPEHTEAHEKRWGVQLTRLAHGERPQ